MTAGASAAAWAEELRRARPWWRRALDALGWWPDTRTGARQRAGAVGEQRTARMLAPLAAEGWHVWHDLAIPGSRANIDHLLVPPHGEYLIALDSKLWSTRRGTVRMHGGRLVHGDGDQRQDRHRCVETARWEAQRVREVTGLPVAALIVVHSAPVTPGLILGGVPVIGAEALLRTLRGHAGCGVADAGRVRRVAARVDGALREYG